MQKYCRNCGSTVSETDAFCTHCGFPLTNSTPNTNTTSKKKKLPIWALILIIIGSIIFSLLILFIIIGVIAYNYSKTDDDYYSNTIPDYTETEELLGTIGDTITSNSYKITLKKATIYDEIEGDTYTDTPDEDKDFLIFMFDVKNISIRNKHLSYYNFEGYPDYQLTNPLTSAYIFNKIDNIGRLDTTIGPNQNTLGLVAFEVDKDWEYFEVHLKDTGNYSNSQDIVFKVVNN